MKKKKKQQKEKKNKKKEKKNKKKKQKNKMKKRKSTQNQKSKQVVRHYVSIRPACKKATVIAAHLHAESNQFRKKILLLLPRELSSYTLMSGMSGLMAGRDVAPLTAIVKGSGFVKGAREAVDVG